MKKLITALTAAAFLASGISTASAVNLYTSIGDCQALRGSPESWNTDFLAEKLRSKGIKYDSIETFGSCFKVNITRSDGQHTIQLYDPMSLNRIER